MKTFFALFFIAASLLAQYKTEHLDLIETTFQRQFDREIINKYLQSNDSASVNAALLSIAHSRDTTFIPIVTQVDFRYYEHILFALSQIGQSEKSASYILSKLHEETDPLIRYNLFISIGSTGDSSDMFYLLNNFNIEPGIPTSIFRFHSRDIRSEEQNYYLSAALNQINNDDLLFETLFSYYRIGPLERDYKRFLELLAEPDSNVSIESRLNTINCLRSIHKFEEVDVCDKLVTHSDWRIRSEAARILCYFNYKSSDEIYRYLKLIDDVNPNVSLTAAISIRDISVNSELTSVIKEFIFNKINSGKLSTNIRGELFISLCSISDSDIPDLIDRYSDHIEFKFLNQAVSYYDNSPVWIYDFLSGQLPSAKETDLLSIVPPLLKLQGKLVDFEDYDKTVLTLLNSGYPSTISIVADGIDSLFIMRNSNILQQIILDKSFQHMNDAQFVESIFSLINLSSKISHQFNATITALLANSGLKSIRSKLNLGDKKVNTKLPGIFNKIIESAFKYSGAIVSTSKGNFKIKFLPGYAPVSTGNFCYLAEQNYFDDVTFHRVVPDFVIQTGDSSGTGWGGPGYEIISEFSPLHFKRGYAGMASAGFDTEGSQWFVMHSYHPHLNGRYSIWGIVTEGMSVVDEIDQEDKILSIELKR
ncbi:MAG: peptidylprolyl isomerase [Melioribacteraceae bacterium]|nr:peptidylprolyl isomerase [Melioribacteraceae bacterium]